MSGSIPLLSLSPQQRQLAQQLEESRSAQSVIEEALTQEEDEEAQYEAVLNDANLRIEQGTLYKLIMNHNIFDGRDEDPRAIENVQREIRKFAKERLEIMLGMRQEVAKNTIVSSPFNDLEVMVLKRLASTYSKGATENSDAVKVAETVAKAPRKEGLNPIGGSKPAVKPALPAKKAAPAAVPAKALQQPKAPLHRSAKAAEQMKEAYVPPTKEPKEVTATDLIERNKQAQARQAGRKSAKSSTSLPMPTADQEEMFQTQRVMTSDNPLANSNVVSAIVAKLNQSKS